MSPFLSVKKSLPKKNLSKLLSLLIMGLCFNELAAQPIIRSFTPVSGAPGTVVKIVGSGFDVTPANNIVYFGTVRASVTNATNTLLTVVTPSGAGFNPITVTQNGLTAYSSISFTATFRGKDQLQNESFTPAGDLTTGESPYSVATGDLDGDGKPDIVSINGGYPYSVSIYRNISANGAISFEKNTSLNTGKVPYDVAMGDINGDGKLDLIVTNSGDIYSYSISVFRNTSTNGSISFDEGIRYETGGSPTSVCISDLNLDGKPDIAVTNYISGTISVFQNAGTNGVISFATKQDYTVGTYPTGIASGDLNGDGKPELAVVNNLHETLSVLKNTSTTGLVSFSDRVDYSTGTSPSSVRIDDLDGDGKSDVIVSNAAAKSVFLFRNTSTGAGPISFAATTESILGSFASYFDLADLDGDGRPDLAITGDSIVLARNTSSIGRITFDRAYAISRADNISVADLDMDGKPDLATINVDDNIISIYKNTIDGPYVTSFAPTSAVTGTAVTIRGTNFKATNAVTFGGEPAAAFTVTADSIITAIVGEGASGPVQVTTAIRSGKLSGFIYLSPPAITSITPSVGTKGSVISIKGKDLKEITAVSFGGVPATSFTSQSDTSVIAVVGAGASGPVSLSTPYGNSSLPGFVYVVEGIAPVINNISPLSGPVGTIVTIRGSNFSTNPAANIVRFGPVRGKVVTATTTELTVAVPTGANYRPITVTTGRLTASTAQPFNVTFSSGGGPFTSNSFKSPVNFPASIRPEAIEIDDLDEDGKSDIVIAHSKQGGTCGSVLKNISTNGTLAFDTSLNLQGYDVGGAVHVTSGDLDGDGKLDLIYSTNYGGVCIFKNASSLGMISFPERILLPIANRPDFTVIADLDSDGKPDIAAISAASSTMTLFRNTSIAGVISFQEAGVVNTGRYPLAIKAGDLDGDGKPELIVPNSNDNNISIYKNMTAGKGISFASRVDYATLEFPCRVAIGDLDDDGMPEIIVAGRSSPNDSLSVFKNRSAGGLIKFAPMINYPTDWGANNVELEDLDGDKRLDIISPNGPHSISMFRNTNSNGTISLEDSVNFDIRDFTTGLSIGDMNGDGKPDIAVPLIFSDILAILQNDIATDQSPIVHSFTPAAAPADDIITIRGQHFTNATTVAFGGLPAKSFTVMSDSVIYAIVANGASGMISTTTPYGTGAIDGFNFITNTPALTVGAIFPDSATTGTIVTIIGTGFYKIKNVLFGGSPASRFIIVSDTLISAVVGTGASGDVGVAGLDTTVYIPGFSYITPPPVITSFRPVSATIGQPVKIYGRNFTGITQVSFGGTPATSFIVDSTGVITAVIGSGISGAVSVTAEGGTSTRPGFTYITPPPIINSFTPVAATIGDTVNISGENFSSTKDVLFGGVSALRFVVNSDSSITAIVGPGTSGEASVVTVNSIGKLAGFTYIVPTPFIKSFVPSSATTGTTVYINGSNFTDVSQVMFGGIPAASFELDSTKGIKAIVANGASGEVSVTTAGGTAVLPGFTYISSSATPVITSFTPLSATKGETVSITGSNLSNVTQVLFGGKPTTSFVIHSSTSITAIVGDGATGPITVITTKDTVNQDGFTYILHSPVISSFIPTSAAKGDTIRISGINFNNITQLLFGGVPAASFAVNSNNQIMAIVGDGASGDITVISGEGNSSMAGFIFMAPPIISSFAPVSATSGTLINISGNNFLKVSQVLFGGVRANSFIVNSPTNITAIVGEGASGAVSVIANNSIDSLPGFTYKKPPSVSPKALVVYPNPVFNGTVSIKHPMSAKTAHILLVDINGTVIKSLTVPPGETQTSLTGMDLLSGIYQIYWSDDDRRILQRVVIP
ncbi:IPT/TIG domain-containing protein [Chitinophaga filiformis]|uniref:IPT/TIG domain-containing protein n=1 Tax=Chitinophaga filiformis TaxID=104663 RepID=A0ABY4HXK6_CHIFI|nr:FG-GAP-like repeat-containing protein [Chitinophaga filiformis]UPK67899.1 IPT/TIG domain-containing protein [Chitinophaga filiformis]